MTDELTLAWMKDRIDDSNKGAAKNRNLYPVQEQATQDEIWEYISCSCDTTCSCRKAGCMGHWKLKKGVTADEFRLAFLRTFVDRCEHLNLLKALERKEMAYPVNRYKEAYAVLRLIGDEWEHLAGPAAANTKTLFCDGWDSGVFRKAWEDIDVRTGIYRAKMYCLLLPDTCVPYDSRSLVKMLKFLEIPPSSDYYTLLLVLREKFLQLLESRTLPEIRRLDAPGRCLDFNPRYISFPRPGFAYGPTYDPAERPLGFVLDKCFYNPKGSPGTE
jgi:hypothetical protein